MEILLSFAILLAVFALALYAFYFLMSLIDSCWLHFFDKPVFVHVYPIQKKITVEEEYFLNQNFTFYRKLSNRRKSYFNHRLAKFNSKYRFIARENMIVTNEMKTLVGGTYVMLTFGMRNYLVSSFDKILVYPEVFYSANNEQYFKGEFNPKLKTVVYSWKHFLESHNCNNDNLNLGIHEFVHAIHFHALKNNDSSSLCFKKHYIQILKEVNYPVNRQRLINSDYFRVYAYTNQFEFISVIVEHFFETPLQFKVEFPELYAKVSLLLNHK